MLNPRAKAAGIALALAALVAGIDQYTKGLVVGYLFHHESPQLFSGMLELKSTYNTGTAFGLFNTMPVWLVLSISLVILGVFLALIWPHLSSRLGVAVAALVLGGALGNIVDRVLFQHVRDFIYFHIGDAFHWPVFNFADICVVVGVGLLVIKVLVTGDTLSGQDETPGVVPCHEPVPGDEAPAKE